MKPIRVFYSVYVPPGKIRAILDAIRLIANPASKHPAHITVRGPYADYKDPRAWSAAIQGQTVHICGVGTFFESGQSTVFLKVESPAIQTLWHKPDYPGYNPHLTIYDGDSRAFAEELQGVLESCDPAFAFQALGLEPLASGNGRASLHYFYDPEDATAFLGRPVSLAEIVKADEGTRLSWIGALAEQLTPHACAR